MIDLLDEVIEIPFEVFWTKFLEKRGLGLNKHESGAIWFMMKVEQREAVFTDVASCNQVKNIISTEYLKMFI